MTRLSDLRTHLTGMQELAQVVDSMRSVANLRVQEAVAALASVRQYGATMEQALRQALPLAGPADPDRGVSATRAVIVCASEQGFVGAFNRQLIEEAARGLQSGDRLFVLGSRGTVNAREHRLTVHWSRPMATRLASVPHVVSVLVDALYAQVLHREVGSAEVVYAGCRRGAAPVLVRRRLFPLSLPEDGPAAPRDSPLHYLPAAVLLQRLTAAYVFAILAEAATESIASENDARLMAMQAAHDNVGRRLGELRQELALARQEEITTELLDLVAGGMALAPYPPEGSAAAVAGRGNRRPAGLRA